MDRSWNVSDLHCRHSAILALLALFYKRLQWLVVALVELPERARLERPPPVLMLDVPAHRLVHSRGEIGARRPAQCTQLGAVQRVAVIVAGAIRDVLL